MPPLRRVAGKGVGAARPDPRYLALCLVLFVLAVSYTLKQEWGTALDIWEHAAVLRELAADPLDPGHPLFPMDEPHQFYSPYSLALGVASRLSGLSVVTVLSLAGIANLLLLFTALWLFVTRLTGRGAVAFYALLFLVFLWGAGAWYFSGFLHFKVLPLVLPYPATLAAGLVLLALWLHLGFLGTGRPLLLVAVGLLASLVMLTHPIDTVVLAAGMAALALHRGRGRVGTNLLWVWATLASAFLLACLWPWFSLWSLLFGEANEAYRSGVAFDDHFMYMGVLARTWPMLVVLPLVARRLLADRRDALALWFVALLAVYLVGWATGEWSYGRLIAAVMLVGAIVLAEERVDAGEAAASGGDAGRPALRWVRLTTVGLVAVGVVQARDGFATVLPEALVDRVPRGWVEREVELVPVAHYEFLERFVGDGDVVIADGYTALEVPAFGGKVLGVPRPEAFVDNRERLADLALFYDEGASTDDRRAVIARQRASYVLVSNDGLAWAPERYRPLFELGPVAYRSSRFTLLDVGSVTAPP